MTTRISLVPTCSNPLRLAWALALIAVALLAARPAHAATRRSAAADDAEGSLAESQMASRRRAATKDLDLEPMVEVEVARPRAQQFDIAVVPFKILINKGKSPMVFERTCQYFGAKGFKVAPRPQVEAAIKEMGLLSNEAIQLNDCDAIARALGCRYLAFGTVKLAKTDTGFSPVGAAVSSANVLMGGLGGLAAASAVPFVAGALALSAVGGFTAVANVDLECRIYDNTVQKIIWVGTESFVAKKHLMAVFANKRKLQEQALNSGLKKLFDPIITKLEPMKGRVPSVD